MNCKHVAAALAVTAVFASAPALAYVGPGAGLTLLSALWGLILAVFVALGFVLLWPIKRWRRRRQAALEAASEMDDEADDPVAAREASRSGSDR